MTRSYLYDLKGFVIISVEASSRKRAEDFVDTLDALTVVVGADHEMKSLKLGSITFYSDDETGPLLLEIDGKEID